MIGFLEGFLNCTIDSNLDLPTWCPNFNAGRDQAEAGFAASSDKLDAKIQDVLRPPTKPRVTTDIWMQASAILIDEVDFTVTVIPPVELVGELYRTCDFTTPWRLWHHVYQIQCNNWFKAMIDLVSHPEINLCADKVKWLCRMLWFSRDIDIDGEKISETFQKGLDLDALDLKTTSRNSMSMEELVRIDPGFLLSYLLTRNYGKYYLVTKQGRIGLSMKPATPGDQLCYIPGGNYIQILSPTCDRYIASASIHGLIDDALLQVVGSQPVWTSITLQ